MRRQKLLTNAAAFMLLAPACEPPPDPIVNPTWADVEPILRGACNHCHGSTAATTGSAGPAVYRFDFFDMQACEDASAAMDVAALAFASASALEAALTPAAGAMRPRMPPAPAEPLLPWQRQTLIRWARNPVRGPAPPENRAPFLRVIRLPSVVSERLAFTAIVEDSDGDPAVGIIRLGDTMFKMSRPGAFAVDIDVSAWPAGAYEATAILCDGWVSANVGLGHVVVERPQ